MASSSLVARFNSALVAAALLLAVSAAAHEPSRALISLDIDGAELAGRWDVALTDLEAAIGLDLDGDRSITWGELEAQRFTVLDHLAGRIAITASQARCALALSHRSLTRHGGVAYAVVDMDGRCAAPLSEFVLDYRFLVDIDPTHQAIVDVNAAGAGSTLIVANNGPGTSISVVDGAGAQISDFVAEGVVHIFAGYDHLAFLALLVLPAAMRKRSQGGPQALVWPLIAIVTSFTVAHSLTLGLATFGYVTVSAQVIEAVIAGSIAVAAILNLIPRMPAVGPALAFGFGLVHGLGFANALSTIGGGAHRFYSLLGFNLGVELGQIALVAASVPLLYAISRIEALRRPVFVASSILLGGLGTVWLVERAVV